MPEGKIPASPGNPEVCVTRSFSYTWKQPETGWPVILYPNVDPTRVVPDIIATTVVVNITRRDDDDPQVTRIAIKGRWSTGRVIGDWYPLRFPGPLMSVYAPEPPDWVLELADEALKASRATLVDEFITMLSSRNGADLEQLTDGDHVLTEERVAGMLAEMERLQHVQDAVAERIWRIRDVMMASGENKVALMQALRASLDRDQP
jgi:hypothetical protein